MLAVITLGTALIFGIGAWWCRRGWLAEARALAASQEAVQRVARLAAIDLRDVAVRLHGRAGSLADQARPDDAAALAAMSERCRVLAEDLGAVGPVSEPILRDEPVDLVASAHEALAGMAATIVPGRRQVRVELPVGELLVWGDRRAVRHVLARVLGEAALNTRQDDWIGVALEHEADGGVALIVSDEGIGLAASEPACVARDSRGIGARLAMARALMEAHDGGLRVVAALGTGTRVSLHFPGSRVREAGRAPS